MADKQLIIVVEGTAAMGPYWKTIVSDYLEKIIRSFCSSDTTVQKSSASAASGSTFELALVMFNTHGPYSAYMVQRSGWTRDIDNFFSWLSTISFSGGGLDDVAIAEGLSEALMMFAIPENGFETQQNLDGKRHCILVSASNPYPLPTPVYRPAIKNLEQAENGEAQIETLLHDAETVSKWFGQCSVSLSVICPKQRTKYRAIYDAAKLNQKSSPPAVDVKHPHYLVLVSDSFIEACTALSRSGVPPNQNSVSTPPLGSGAPASLPSANGSNMLRPPISSGIVPQATIKVEPSTVTSIGSGPAHPHMASMPRASPPSVPSLQAPSPPSVSQEISMNNESVTELKPTVSMSQNPRAVGALLNIVSSAARGSHMSNMISSGMASTGPPQTVLSSGQSGVPALSGSGTITGTSQPVQNTAMNSYSTATSNVSTNSNLGMSQLPTNLQGSANNTLGANVSGINQANPSMAQSGTSINQNMMSGLGTNGGPSGTGPMMPTPGMPQQVGMNNSASNIGMSQQGSTSLPSSQSKYVKVWEGNLSGQRQGQPVFITKLEGYRNATASETLAANWPPTMQIVRLISQDHMNNKQYVGKADFLVFRAMNQHGFLSQLQEKKLCAVIQLPSQTLLLSVSDKACRLIGMLFPGDMVVFKPQIPAQQQQQQMHQQMQQQQLQQNQQMQHQQQQNQQMQHQPQQNQQMQHQQQQQPQSRLQQQQLQHMQQQTMQQMQQLPQMQQSLQHMQHQQQQQQPMQQLQQLQQQQQPMQQQQQQPMQQLQQQQPMQQLQQQQQQQQQQHMPPLQQQQQISQLQQQQQIPQLQQQQIPQLQQLQQQSQPQQIVGTSMAQGYMQGPGRPQLAPQGQVPSQGTPPNMAGGGFMG